MIVKNACLLTLLNVKENVRGVEGSNGMRKSVSVKWLTRTIGGQIVKERERLDFTMSCCSQAEAGAVSHF